MKTYHIEVTIDDRFFNDEWLRRKLTIAPDNAAGAEQTIIKILPPPLTGRALAAKARGEAFENSFEGSTSENYSYGYIAGYKARAENGGGE